MKSEIFQATNFLSDDHDSLASLDNPSGHELINTRDHIDIKVRTLFYPSGAIQRLERICPFPEFKVTYRQVHVPRTGGNGFLYDGYACSFCERLSSVRTHAVIPSCQRVKLIIMHRVSLIDQHRQHS